MLSGELPAAVSSRVTITRDRQGIPRVESADDPSLFFGFGYAVAQDRLFQLDYLRRRATGRLAEVLGPEGVEIDLVARTVGLPQIAEREWRALPEETRVLVSAYADGVNAFLAQCGDLLPIEFALLDYRPEPWRPQDSLAIAGEFRWYLTGRFPVIAIPELAKRTLGDGALYRAFLEAEADDEAILPAGSYPATRAGTQPVGVSVNDPHEGHGSNNWVIAGNRSVSGGPLLASDPHIAFAAVSCWHEVHLRGGSFNVAGISYVGMPAVMFGRNERVAWGITNNICSQRDLYQEQTSAEHPGCFLYDGRWEPWRERVETIAVKGSATQTRTIRSSRNGPVVNDILPGPAQATGDVSLRWLGMSYCGWLPALLAMDRARTGAELRAATDPWRVPTFCVVYADVDGQIGYQCTGRIPIRDVWERGYRPGWDPRHQWQGLISFEGMPHVENPPRGWIGTANNRVAADDFPYPLSGTWGNGYRGIRIRQMIESRSRLSRRDMAAMHLDTVSLRAVAGVPAVAKALEDHANPRIREALGHLLAWDCRMEPDRIAAAIFNVFFTHWSQSVADVRFEGDAATLVAGAIGGLALRLLSADPAGWFQSDADRRAAIAAAFESALASLEQKFGLAMVGWNWGRLHVLQQKHFLSGRGDLGLLLDRGGEPVRGDYVTVCNTGQGSDFSAPTGAGYRMIVDLGDPQPRLWAIDAGSESGCPGSRHFDDQLSVWQRGEYHELLLSTAQEGGSEQAVLELSPRR